MINLMFFNKNNEFVNIADFETLTWTRNFYTTGTFSATLPMTEKNVSLCELGNRIYIKDNNPDSEIGIITTIIKTLGTNGQETLQIGGSFSDVLLAQRICWETVSESNATVSLFIISLLWGNAIGTSNSDRDIPNFNTELTSNTIFEWLTKQTTYGNLLTTIQDLLTSYEYSGYNRFDLNDKMLYFNAKKGIDRTASQDVNAKALFSRSFYNVVTQTATESSKDYANCALIGGEGEGDNRILTTVGDATGLDRYEIFVDAKDLTKTVDEVTMTDAEYLEALQRRGNEKLAERKKVQSLEGTYRMDDLSDADLGDYVTVFDKDWNLQLDTQITTIARTYNRGTTETSVTFGNKAASIFSKVDKLRNGE